MSRDRITRLLMLFIALCLAGFIGVGFIMWGVLVRQWDGPWVRRAVDFFQIPAAKVGDRTIPYGDYLIHIDAVSNVLKGPAARAQGLPTVPTVEIRQQTMDSLLRAAVVEEMAAARGIVLTPLDIDRAYDRLVSGAGTSTTPDEVKTFLEIQFGWSIPDFKERVVQRALREDEVRRRVLMENPDPAVFDQMIADRLAKKDVKTYLRISF